MWVHNKATSEQTSTPYKFTSKELDEETGLYYFGARYYDARLSRWLSTDAAYSSLDFYNYCNHNPVMYIDPDGNFPTPFALASVSASAYGLVQDYKNGDPAMIGLSAAGLFFDLVSLYPLNPMPGGAGILLQTQRLARQIKPVTNELNYVAHAGKNALKDYNENGSFSSAALMFAGTYSIERGISSGMGQFLPGGAKEELSEKIFDGVQLATNLTVSATSDSVSNRNQDRKSSENKIKISGNAVNPWSIDWAGTGTSLLDMTVPESKK